MLKFDYCFAVLVLLLNLMALSCCQNDFSGSQDNNLIVDFDIDREINLVLDQINEFLQHNTVNGQLQEVSPISNSNELAGNRKIRRQDSIENLSLGEESSAASKTIETLKLPNDKSPLLKKWDVESKSLDHFHNFMKKYQEKPKDTRLSSTEQKFEINDPNAFKKFQKSYQLWRVLKKSSGESTENDSVENKSFSDEFDWRKRNKAQISKQPKTLAPSLRPHYEPRGGFNKYWHEKLAELEKTKPPRQDIKSKSSTSAANIGEIIKNLPQVTSGNPNKVVYNVFYINGEGNLKETLNEYRTKAETESQMVNVLLQLLQGLLSDDNKCENSSEEICSCGKKHCNCNKKMFIPSHEYFLPPLPETFNEISPIQAYTPNQITPISHSASSQNSPYYYSYVNTEYIPYNQYMSLTSPHFSRPHESYIDYHDLDDYEEASLPIVYDLEDLSKDEKELFNQQVASSKEETKKYLDQEEKVEPPPPTARKHLPPNRSNFQEIFSHPNDLFDNYRLKKEINDPSNELAPPSSQMKRRVKKQAKNEQLRGPHLPDYMTNIKTPPQRIYNDAEPSDLKRRPRPDYDPSGVNFPQWFNDDEAEDLEDIAFTPRGIARAIRHKIEIGKFYGKLFSTGWPVELEHHN